MLPFLRLHALAATRGDGLRPELRILFERLAGTSEAASNVGIADWHQMEVTRLSSRMVPMDPPHDDLRDPKGIKIDRGRRE
jgi:hypothetical protein